MAVEDRTRHDRLRSLLPRVYATDPREHALGVMLEVLGDSLRELDRYSERALRDRWLRTATAPRDYAQVLALGEDKGTPWLTQTRLRERLAAELVTANAEVRRAREQVQAAVETRAPL
ncbi:MAG: hypothetical protein KC431_01325, partial [Myxococcales bacterium]|nr:hypothetical protein [Myxococcales bacterium]